MDYAAQIHQLESLLPLIRTTRAALPSLVSCLSPPTPSPHLDLATLYRLASNQCEVSIKLLADQLQAVAATLKQADESFDRDSNGIGIRKSEVEDPWQKIGQVLAGPSGSRTCDNKVFEPKLDAPKSNEELTHFLASWQTNHPRVSFDLQQLGSGEKDTVRLELKLKGVMRSTLVLRWEETERLMVEVAACFSLKENNPMFRPSRYSLFQELTNSVMSLIERSQAHPGERVSNLEEILTFLSSPPLPF